MTLHLEEQTTNIKHKRSKKPIVREIEELASSRLFISHEYISSAKAAAAAAKLQDYFLRGAKGVESKE